ncbi:MAG TPA: HEAT repeat domain-containing protein [Planctomycetota bacterium]|nr:HEAT repeat domain-containing protein [Planctomycetota bacterium]
MMTVFVLSWWLLPRWQPRLVAQYSPWPEPALRGMRYDQDDESYHLVDQRLLSFGPAIGPALLRQFEVGDHQHRLRVIALGTEIARSDGIAAGTAVPATLRERFRDEDLALLREDLHHLVLVALADGSTYLPSNASYIAASLRDPRLVQSFCAFLAKQKPPVFEDLEPVIRTLGTLRDARAVPVLIPLLPIRHRAHAVVEDALDQCLDDSSLVHVIAATKHSHEVIRTWAARQFPRYATATELGRCLVALLDDGERQVRVAAVQGLSAGNYQAVCPRLIILAEHEEDPPVRAAAVEALGDMAYLPAAPCLRALVATAPGQVRNEAIIALGDLADAESFPMLLPLLQNDDKTVALKAHWSLSQLPLTTEQRQAVDAIWPIDPTQVGKRSAQDPTLRPSPAPP